MGFSYALYLLLRAQTKMGWITVSALWVVMSVTTLAIDPPLLVYALSQTVFAGVIRAVYFRSRLLTAALDVSLVFVGLCAGAWAAFETNSVFMSAWCFFVVQTLGVFIPETKQIATATGQSAAVSAEFESALAEAKKATNRMASAA